MRFASISRLGAFFVKPLREAALLQKTRFKLPKLLVEQIVGLVNQADERVGCCLRSFFFNKGPLEHMTLNQRVAVLTLARINSHDLPELLQRSFQVFHDLQRDDVWIGEVVGGFEGFVLEPEDVEAGLVAAYEFVIRI
jgi:hypothetical protein